MSQWKLLRKRNMDKPAHGAGAQVTARIEIALLSNGQMAFNMQVPSRFIFNAMMETGKQQGLQELMTAEQQKVKLPDVDVSRLKL